MSYLTIYFDLFFIGGIYFIYFFISDVKFTVIPDVKCKTTSSRIGYPNITAEYFQNKLIRHDRIRTEKAFDTEPFYHYFVENDKGFRWCDNNDYIEAPGSTLYTRQRGKIQFY